MFQPKKGYESEGHESEGYKSEGYESGSSRLGSYRPKIGLWQKSLTWNSQPVEILLAALSLTRVYLLAPWDSFQFSPTLYRLFQVLPQPFWGLLGVTLGIGTLLFCLRDERNHHLTTRRNWIAAMMLQYVVYATLFALSNPYSLAWLDRAILAWGALWCVANLSFRRAWQKRVLQAWLDESTETIAGDRAKSSNGGNYANDEPR